MSAIGTPARPTVGRQKKMPRLDTLVMRIRDSLAQTRWVVPNKIGYWIQIACQDDETHRQLLRCRVLMHTQENGIVKGTLLDLALRSNRWTIAQMLARANVIKTLPLPFYRREIRSKWHAFYETLAIERRRLLLSLIE